MTRHEVIVELTHDEERLLPAVGHPLFLRDYLAAFPPPVAELAIPLDAQIAATTVDVRRAVRIVVLRHPSFPVVPPGHEAEVWRSPR